ncbi:hypothetical protein [Streptomyces sp. NPDC086182]|uniref:hypothetical protein n=1 Tax=Streptomyces sp. NPDC086182 TaxID=3155058 RepID=UPI00344563A9
MPYDSDRLARLVQDHHTGQVIDLENQIATASLGNSESLFAQLIRRTLAAWTRAFGGPDQPAVPGDLLRRILAAARAAVRRILDGVVPQADNALTGSLGDALLLGMQQGREFLRAATGRSRRTPDAPRPSRTIRQEAHRIRDIITTRRDRALQLLHPNQVTRWADLLTGLGSGHASLSAARAHISWVINTAINQGLDELIRATAKTRLWVAEADACVRCLAYTGRVVAVDEPFPGGLSWDPRQRRVAEPVEGPPLHPHCRCRTVPWSDRWTTSGVPFPLALQREAHRGIAYGRARPSESRAARIRAAGELLRTEPDLLPAVEARARTAVRTGRFTQAA